MGRNLAVLILLGVGVSGVQSVPHSTGGIIEAQEEAHPPKRIRVGGAVQRALLAHQVAPKYPSEAKEAHVQGTVRLQAIIGTDGTVKELKVLSGHPALVQSALDTVRQWRYQPTLLNGEPVEVETTVDVIYSLEGSPSPNEGSPVSEHAHSIGQPPFDRLELLAFIAGQFSDSSASQQIRQRGASFAPDGAFLSAIQSLGTGSQILDAVRSLKPRLEHHPSRQREAPYMILLGTVHDLSKLKFASARAGYQEALKLAPDSAALHLAYAMDLLILKDYGGAELESRRSLQLWPDDAEAHSVLATALGSEYRDTEAVPEAREALRLFPNDKAALIQLGFSLTRSRQYSEAIPVLREAIPRAPEMPLLRKHLGVSLFHTGDVDGAIEELTTFLKIEPNDAEGHYDLRVALRQRGRHSEAQAQFREAARIEPNNPLYATVAGSAGVEKPSNAAAGLRPDEGSISGNVYTNKFFGFSFEFPRGWTVAGADVARGFAKLGGTLLANGDPILQDAARASGRISYPLLLVIEGVTRKQELSARTILIIASDIRSQPNLKSGEDFLKLSATMHEELRLPMEVVGMPHELPLGGRKFWMAGLTLRTTNGIQHAAQAVTIERGYVLQFLLLSPDTAGLGEMMKTLQSLRFLEKSK
jgi:TonB family protein